MSIPTVHDSYATPLSALFMKDQKKKEKLKDVDYHIYLLYPIYIVDFIE